MLYVLLYKYIQNIKRCKHSIKRTIGTQHALTNTLATLALVFQKEWVLLKDKEQGYTNDSSQPRWRNAQLCSADTVYLHLLKTN